MYIHPLSLGYPKVIKWDNTLKSLEYIFLKYSNRYVFRRELYHLNCHSTEKCQSPLKLGILF